MALEKDFRSPHSPSPIYGDGSLSMNPNSKGQGLLRPGFTVGDLDRSYTFSGISGSAPLSAIASTSTAVVIGAAVPIHPKARVIKVIINVTAGSGSVDVKMRTNTDSYATDVFDSGALTLGSHSFYVGGWSSPVSNNDAAYTATKYGPTKAGSATDSGNTTGSEATTNPDPDASSNYVGGTYNPVDFLSLQGDDVEFYSSISGSVTYDVEVIPVS